MKVENLNQDILKLAQEIGKVVGVLQRDIQTLKMGNRNLRESPNQAPFDTPCSSAIELMVGQTVTYDGKSLMILLVGKTQVLLRIEEKLIEFPLKEFDSLVQQGKINLLG